MSYRINRLVKSKNRENKDEIFLEISITDDLGTYPFGVWLPQDDFDRLKNDYDPSDFESWNNLDGFKTLQNTNNEINNIVESILPIARKNREGNIAAEEYRKAHPELSPNPLLNFRQNN